MGTVRMSVLLTLVTILISQPSLGQDGQSVDIHHVEPRYECPEVNVDFNGNNIGYIPGVPDWRACGSICSLTPDCMFWTWNHVDHNCFLKTSDEGLANYYRTISGARGCK